MVFWGHWLLPCHPFSLFLVLLGVEIRESIDNWYIHDAIVTSCAFRRHAQTTLLSEQQEVLFPSNFGLLVLPSQGGVGGSWFA